MPLEKNLGERVCRCVRWRLYHLRMGLTMLWSVLLDCVTWTVTVQVFVSKIDRHFVPLYVKIGTK
jgi:hypothetical protein